MARLRFAPFAEQAVRDLPRDKALLANLWRELEAVADDLDGRTEFPPPLPHRQDRRLANFFVEDGERSIWGFSASLSEEGDAVVVHVLNGANAEAYYDIGSPPTFELEPDPDDFPEPDDFI